MDLQKISVLGTIFVLFDKITDCLQFFPGTPDFNSQTAPKLNRGCLAVMLQLSFLSGPLFFTCG